MNNNPLIAKWEELYKPKEEPKPQKLKTTYTKDELEALAPYLNTNSNKLTTNTNPNNYITASSHSVSARPIKSYDLQSGEDSFLQVAEKVKNKLAQVISVSMSRDTFLTELQTFTFEVKVYDGP